MPAYKCEAKSGDLIRVWDIDAKTIVYSDRLRRDGGEIDLPVGKYKVCARGPHTRFNKEALIGSDSDREIRSDFDKSPKSGILTPGGSFLKCTTETGCDFKTLDEGELFSHHRAHVLRKQQLAAVEAIAEKAMERAEILSPGTDPEPTKYDPED